MVPWLWIPVSLIAGAIFGVMLAAIVMGDRY